MANRAAALDGCFRALAHPVRRGMLERLRRGSATVGALAGPYGLAAPTISKHLRVLEKAGLVARERVGREHILTLQAEPLLSATTWLSHYREFWNVRLDALEGVLAAMDEPPPRRRPKERTT